jgi:hypothetical protein
MHHKTERKLAQENVRENLEDIKTQWLHITRARMRCAKVDTKMKTPSHSNGLDV